MANPSFTSKILGLLCAVIVFTKFSPIAAKTQPSMSGTQVSSKQCEPTAADYLGPYYEPDAPLRSSVGKGYKLEGTIISSADCTPIQNARIELWLANPARSYDDNHRATMFSDDAGAYSFESNFPPGYYGRPPHIHIRVSVEGHKTLATQHYPTRGDSTGRFDIVMVPLE